MSSQHFLTNECRGLCNYFISFNLAKYFRDIPVYSVCITSVCRMGDRRVSLNQTILVNSTINISKPDNTI